MKHFSLFLLLLGISSSLFAQEKYFHELRGFEDSTGTTHLFYRLYDATEDEDFTTSTNHVYHFSSESASDSIFFFSRTRFPLQSGMYQVVGDYMFADGKIESPFHTYLYDDNYDNYYTYLYGYDDSFFHSGHHRIVNLDRGLNDSLSYFVLGYDTASVVIIEGNSLALPSKEYDYSIKVKSTENFTECDLNDSYDCILGASDSVLIYNSYNTIQFNSANDSLIFFQRNDSLFSSNNIGVNLTYINAELNWRNIQNIHQVSTGRDLIATSDTRYYILEKKHSLETYPIFYSSDFGTTWNEVYSDTNRTYFTSSSVNDITGYFGSGNTIYFWDTIDLSPPLLETQLTITGLYYKPNSKTLYVLTENELLELNTETLETTTLKTLPVSNEPNLELPTTVRLLQNYPNPFNPSTIIPFELDRNTEVKLTVFDLLGRTLAVLLDEPRSAGSHEVSFDASALSSGIYFYRLETNNAQQTRKLMVIK